MRGRCDSNHHAQALKRTAIALLAIGVAFATGSRISADAQKLTRSGLVHRVSVENGSEGGDPAATRIVHVQQQPDGTETVRVVSGTDDAATDWDPAIAIDRVTESPVVVWSRNEGQGFDLFVSRFDGNQWSQPNAVATGGGEDVRAAIQIGADLIHLVWINTDGRALSWSRLSLDRDTMEPVFGPEVLPTSTTSTIPPEGETGSGGGSAEPPKDAFFFASELPPVLPGDPGRIVVWGVRDAPIPIDYSQGYLLPSGVHDTKRPTAAWVGDRFALWFSKGNKFYYTYRYGGQWTGLRVIVLEDEVSRADATIQMQEMLQRMSPDISD